MSITKWTAPAPGDLDEDGRKADKATVISYLRYHGYLKEPADDTKLVDLVEPLKALQEESRLPETGLYDVSTARLLDTPVCGNATRGGPLGFVTSSQKWNHTNITWRVDNFSAKISNADALAAFNSSFAKWADITPLTFTQVSGGASADIRIRFAVGNHGDGVNNAFDGAGTAAGNILAHAFYPAEGADNLGGDVHFDDAEAWTVDFLSKVSLHEFGHALGLDHSEVSTAVMYKWFNNEGNLQADDIGGVQSIYGPRRLGWFHFQLASGNTVASGSDIAAVSRIDGAMEVWWIAPDGSVQDAYWYASTGGRWSRFTLAGANSATPGGIAAVSRIPGSMEVWWVAPNGSVRGAYWYDGGAWAGYELAPAGSAARGTKITAVSRIPGSMEVWWVAPDKSVQDAYWYEGRGWQRFTLAGPNSAAIGGGIKAVSRISTSMELFWVAPNGSVQDAFWYEGNSWQRFELAPANSAAITSGIAATTRISSSMEIWWVAPNGSVQDAFWYEGNTWQRFELAPPGSAMPGGIEAVSRIKDSMEVFWTSSNGAVQDANWYAGRTPGNGWARFQLSPAGEARPGTELGVVSRIPTSMEIWFAGRTGDAVDWYWYG